jgi:N-hydroxyarylamine O-acetyltransferase
MSGFPLDAYLDRVGHREAARPDLATLRALHRAHVDRIPFENLDIQMGGAIALDAGTLEAKMIRRRRGGYCFEQNRLFASALESIGFAPDTCEARVRQGLPRASGSTANAAEASLSRTMRPRTHMVLTVRCDGREWLVDVGFGGDGLVEPLVMDGSEVEQAGTVYRMAKEGSLAVFQRRVADAWEDLYAVLPDAVHPIDFEMANWYTSTYPRSPFVLNLTAQRITNGTRHILRNLAYTVARGAESTTREITRAELVPLLRGVFGLDVPEDATFRALKGDSHLFTVSEKR